MQVIEQKAKRNRLERSPGSCFFDGLSQAIACKFGMEQPFTAIGDYGKEIIPSFKLGSSIIWHDTYLNHDIMVGQAPPYKNLLRFLCYYGIISRNFMRAGDWMDPTDGTTGLS